MRIFSVGNEQTLYNGCYLLEWELHNAKTVNSIKTRIRPEFAVN